MILMLYMAIEALHNMTLNQIWDLEPYISCLNIRLMEDPFE
jgi:hypothetical protein